MIPLQEAQGHVLQACQRISPTTVRSQDALGCVTAQAVVAKESVPAFDNTAMDGYAVRVADIGSAPARLHVIGEVRAGMAAGQPVGAGEAIQIMTGTPIPNGADAIVMVEETTREGNDVLIASVPGPGQFVRRAGSDVEAGTMVFNAGTVLSAAHLGALATIGEKTVEVFPRLRVGILSTGDELVTDGSPLQPGQVREANLDLLHALVTEANCTPIDFGVVRDDQGAISQAIEEAISQCDALITSGGVSMGEYDFVKVVLEQLGTMRWMQIAIQPAKPFAFGMIGTGDNAIPVFGLPGNPVSSLVSFELPPRPALRQMMGHEQFTRPKVRAIADDGLPRRAGDGKTQWQRVHGIFGQDGRLHVRSTGKQGSHQLANSAAANGLAEVPDGTGIAPSGAVDVLLFV